MRLLFVIALVSFFAAQANVRHLARDANVPLPAAEADVPHRLLVQNPLADFRNGGEEEWIACSDASGSGHKGPPCVHPSNPPFTNEAGGVGATTRDTVDEYREERLRMVRRQIAARGIDDPAVLDAMRSVLRHEFVPQQHLRSAYADRPLPIGHGQTISQPYIVAYMTELASPEADDRVLEIGTGSGYQAAVLAEIVDHVYTVEIITELATSARERLDRLEYDNVTVKHADGYYGWEEHAPFDAIVVTAASEHIPPPLIEQLRDGGRMIIPVGTPFRTQMLMLVTKEGDDVKTRSLTPVRFVPFRRGN